MVPFKRDGAPNCVAFPCIEELLASVSSFVVLCAMERVFRFTESFSPTVPTTIPPWAIAKSQTLTTPFPRINQVVLARRLRDDVFFVCPTLSVTA